MQETDDRKDAASIAASDLDLLLAAAGEAGRIAMSYFRKDPDVFYKNGGRSPVSEADFAVDHYLREFLIGARPHYGWLSEETEDTPERLSREYVFIVDPIDGTRAYVNGQPDWCVSIAVVRNGVPTAGVLAAPARGQIWHGAAGGGAFLDGARLPVRRSAEAGAMLNVSVPDIVFKGLSAKSLKRIDRRAGGPSLALRLAQVAGGGLDGAYVRPNASEWDLAAADVLLGETGHRLADDNGHDVTYNQIDPGRGLLIAATRDQVALLRSFLSTGGGH